MNALMNVSELFEEIHPQDDDLSGLLRLPGRTESIRFCIDADLEDATEEEFVKAARAVAEVAKGVTIELEAKLRSQAARAIVEEAYEQGDEESDDEEVKTLEESMTLVSIWFYPENYALVYTSPECPDEEICVLVTLDHEYEEAFLDELEDLVG